MQLMLINVDYKSLLQTDKCAYTGNMNSCSSTEELRFVTTYQTLGKFRFYYSAGMQEGKSGKDGIVVVIGVDTE